ncbi:tyrosine-type recombinase/integrase [Micromonospora olivasterospora]|uniref:Phage integrase family protein n=1 Tax=Micromonospora olivasterospora TaxID=1880 RepID=A0A562I311_MICOL|nr:tyrosine-type recombinase/integrase [Micromonospora olivasterospora]TWH65074.1 phage integrase family protein [Micromonospora olivasterospora]
MPLINNARRTLAWFVADVWGHFDDDHVRPGAPLFPSERKHADGTCRRVGDDALRAGLAEAAAKHLPGWADTLTPHVLRHYAASRLYQGGLDLISIQEVLGHSWIATTMRYVHVHRTHVEDAWAAGHERAAQRLKGLAATLERLRVDRQLEEALTHGPDPLHLAAVFGLDDKTAIRYANAARQILKTEAERHAIACSLEPKDAATLPSSDGPLGSR